MKKVSRRRKIIKTICLSFGAFVMLYPLIFMFMRSLRPESLFFASHVPISEWTFENYIEGWNGFSGLSFTTFFKNSIFLVICCVICNIISCSMTAFAFARLEFFGKNVLFAILMVSMMLPFHVLLIPRFMIFKSFGWLDSYLPLIVPKLFATEGFFCFLMVQFMRGIPRELDQAAMIDGCSPVQIFFRIMLPLCKSAIALTATFTLIWTWNDFFSQLIYISTPEKWTVALGLRSFIDVTSTSHYGQMFAMSVVSIIPIIIFFIFAQKQLVEGIAATGIKG